MKLENLSLPDHAANNFESTLPDRKNSFHPRDQKCHHLPNCKILFLPHFPSPEYPPPLHLTSLGLSRQPLLYPHMPLMSMHGGRISHADAHLRISESKMFTLPFTNTINTLVTLNMSHKFFFSFFFFLLAMRQCFTYRNSGEIYETKGERQHSTW